MTAGLSDPEWCLDFADTVDWRTSEHAEDKIPNYGDLVAWGLRKGLLDRSDAGALRLIAERDPSTGIKVMNDARRLREAIYRVFSAVAHGRRANAGDVKILNEFVSRGLGRKKIQLAKDGFAWTWGDDLTADAVLFPLAQSAADLLTSEDLARVKECANEEQGCGSLFLDCSKGQSRKWCSMESCGNRMKFKTYYDKHTRSRA